MVRMVPASTVDSTASNVQISIHAHYAMLDSASTQRRVHVLALASLVALCATVATLHLTGMEVLAIFAPV
jgi:hypothetical protein